MSESLADKIRALRIQFPIADVGANDVRESAARLAEQWERSVAEILGAEPKTYLALKADRDDLEQVRQGLSRIYEVNAEFHWKLADLFEPGVRGVSPLHYLEEQITAMKAELAEAKGRLRLTAQLLVGEVGADGPCNAEDVAEKAVLKICSLTSELSDLRARVLACVEEGYATGGGCCKSWLEPIRDLVTPTQQPNAVPVSDTAST